MRDYVHWDDQPYSIEAIPDSFARGYRIASTQPQGPVYLCWDAALQEDPVTGPIPTIDASRAQPPAPMIAPIPMSVTLNAVSVRLSPNCGPPTLARISSRFLV